MGVEGMKTHWEEMLERPELDDPEFCAARLIDLLTHLRATHVYCLHCGCHFDDADDMEECCPGFDEEAHENAENFALRKRKAPTPPPKKRPGITVPARLLSRSDDDDGGAFAALFRS